MNALPVYDTRYIKTKIGTYGGKGYTNFRGLNILEDALECESFTIMLIGFLSFYKNRFYLQVYLDNCPKKIVNKQMVDYLGDNLFVGD